MVSLTMLIGLPGSGKSTYAKQLAKSTDAIILSSDSIREELYGDVNDQEHNAAVFAELHKRCKEASEKLINIICDSTNINQKKRMAFLKEFNNPNYIKKAVIIATPYELCLENNAKRDRKVPEYVIKRMRDSFNLPLYGEGFDEIEVVWNMGDMKFDMIQMLTSTYDFDQKNSHHAYSLGEHMERAFAHAYREHGYNHCLSMATRLHDIGKLVTQTFTNKKGEVTEDAHYYGHNFAGCYNALFYLKQYDNERYSDVTILHICTLIQYHMHPYLAWKDSEKARNRDRRLLGDKWFEEVMALHEADLAAHG